MKPSTSSASSKSSASPLSAASSSGRLLLPISKTERPSSSSSPYSGASSRSTTLSFTFPQERQMLLKERASGMYRLSSYFMARTAGDVLMELALSTAFTFIIYWMGGLDPHPATFLLSLLIVLYNVLVAQSLGLAFGAILMEVKQATTLASVTTLTFLIAGGYYVQHILPFILWLKYLSYSFYCFKLLVGIQFRPHDTYECSNGRCSMLHFPAIKLAGLDLLWVDVLIMGSMLVGYRFLAYWALHRLQRPR